MQHLVSCIGAHFFRLLTATERTCILPVYMSGCHPGCFTLWCLCVCKCTQPLARCRLALQQSWHQHCLRQTPSCLQWGRTVVTQGSRPPTLPCCGRELLEHLRPYEASAQIFMVLRLSCTCQHSTAHVNCACCAAVPN